MYPIIFLNRCSAVMVGDARQTSELTNCVRNNNLQNNFYTTTVQTTKLNPDESVVILCCMCNTMAQGCGGRNSKTTAERAESKNNTHTHCHKGKEEKIPLCQCQNVQINDFHRKRTLRSSLQCHQFASAFISTLPQSILIKTCRRHYSCSTNICLRCKMVQMDERRQAAINLYKNQIRPEWAVQS